MATDFPGLSQQIAHFEARILADPGSRVYLPLADLYRRAGKLSEARQVLVRGLSRDAACLSARVLLGVVLTDLGEHETARRELQAVLDRDPDNLLALRIMGDDAAAHADWARAAELMERLLRLLPDDPDVRNALRRYRERRSAEVEGSIAQDEIPAVQEEPLQRPGGQPAVQHAPAEEQPSGERLPASIGVETPTLADLYRRQGHFEKARQIIDRILAIDPQRSDALAVLARLEQDLADPATRTDSPQVESPAALREDATPEVIRPPSAPERGEDLLRFRRWIEGEADRQEIRPPG